MNSFFSFIYLNTFLCACSSLVSWLMFEFLHPSVVPPQTPLQITPMNIYHNTCYSTGLCACNGGIPLRFLVVFVLLLYPTHDEPVSRASRPCRICECTLRPWANLGSSRHGFSVSDRVQTWHIP